MLLSVIECHEATHGPAAGGVGYLASNIQSRQQGGYNQCYHEESWNKLVTLPVAAPHMTHNSIRQAIMSTHTMADGHTFTHPLFICPVEVPVKILFSFLPSPCLENGGQVLKRGAEHHTVVTTVGKSQAAFRRGALAQAVHLTSRKIQFVSHAHGMTMAPSTE